MKLKSQTGRVLSVRSFTFTVVVVALVVAIAYGCIFLNTGSLRSQRFSMALLRERIASLEQMQDVITKDVVRLVRCSLSTGKLYFKGPEGG